ncbi:hypothetical protein GCM10010191_11230 [Actinomadura vinacea]|uniref:Sulfotransferase family protein n=1 Tax=Actinomadura vinacea TaxID=115336 RepID=A0ABN3IJF1_9ACTN
MSHTFADDGSGVIFITGAPGSKWSGIAHALSYAEPVNRSDISEDRTYVGEVGVVHLGNYFGPGMEHGEDFDRLSRLDKEDLVTELAKPFSRPGGTMIMKSHLFSRHLDHLRALFPKARMLLVHRSEEECLDWWIDCGGFDISFPDYSWYQNLDNMRVQIARDNSALMDFTRRHGLRFQRYDDLAVVADALGLRFTEERADSISALPFEKEHGFGRDTGGPAQVLRSIRRHARSTTLAWI